MIKTTLKIFILIVGLSGAFVGAQIPFFSTTTTQASSWSGQKIFNISNVQDVIINELQNFLNVSNYQQWFLPSDYRQLSNYFNDSLPYLVRDSLQKAARQYSSALNSTLAQGFSQTQKAFTELSEIAITAIVMSNNIVKTALVQADSRFNQYQSTVRDCVQQKVGGYSEVLPKARDTAVNCVYNKYRQGLSIIQGTRNDALEAIDGGRQLGEKVTECTKRPSSEVACILVSIANINQKTILLPIQMTKRFGEASQFVTGIRSEIVNCAIQVVAVVAEQSFNATGAIAECLVSN